MVSKIDKDIISLLYDFNIGEFKKIIGKNNNGIMSYNLTHDINIVKNDYRYKKTFDYIDGLYNDGYGIKSIIKDNNLPITYSVLRKFMINIMDLKLRKNNEITDILRSKRSDKVKYEHDNGIGWFGEDVIRENKQRGYQGKYFNKSLEKHVWLRSTYEYIYAMWLDSNNYKWDVEYKSYRLDDNSLYKPDFFIFDSDLTLRKIVEIKGYWENRSYKFYKLKEQLINEDIELEIIKYQDLKKYSNQELKNITKIWKTLRLLEQK